MFSLRSAILACGLVSLAACATRDESTLVGKWFCPTPVTNGNTYELEFGKDGRATMDIVLNGDRMHEVGAWVASGEDLTLTLDPSGADVDATVMKTQTVGAPGKGYAFRSFFSSATCERR